jgi:glutamyl-tRNA synthetase
MDYQKLAERLFPEIERVPEEYERVYPPRSLPDSARVTRLGPSPTGFIHLGNLYGAFADERLSKQSGGCFFLRIEDTDEKRYVEGATEILLTSLEHFGICFDEGATKEGEVGEYGPYYQSARKEIYQCFAKSLVAKGLAYPCFLTEEEIRKIRKEQEEHKKNPGIYGSWAKSRDLSMEEVESRLQKNQPYVIRLRSGGNPQEPATISVEDGIRGSLDMPENVQDVVLLKTNGIPTYHFAHVVDDHLMRTTHVVRGAVWLASLPIHVELFQVMGWEKPIFCHTAQLMKLDEQGNKRKLSKRLDPELSLAYYRQEGYHPKAVREYLMTLLNSNFEEWRLENPGAALEEFPFSIQRMKSGDALFDLNKLKDISKDVLLKESTKEIYCFLRDWACENMPEVCPWFDGDESYLMAILDLGRGGEKPRKDLVYARQMVEFIGYFFDEFFILVDPLPDNVGEADVKPILEAYLETYDHKDNQEAWFSKIRALAERLNYAAKPKDYKKEPERYKGHVGDVSTVIRLAIVGRSQSPDLWEIQQILGEERTRQRIQSFLETRG